MHTVMIERVNATLPIGSSLYAQNATPRWPDLSFTRPSRTRSEQQPHRLETSTGVPDAIASLTTSPHCSVVLAWMKHCERAYQAGRSAYDANPGIRTEPSRPRLDVS